jgi:hypothetical protein
MGLKGYRLWVNLIQPAEPHRVPQLPEASHDVALQVAFERQT